MPKSNSSNQPNPLLSKNIPPPNAVAPPDAGMRATGYQSSRATEQQGNSVVDDQSIRATEQQSNRVVDDQSKNVSEYDGSIAIEQNGNMVVDDQRKRVARQNGKTGSEYQMSNVSGQHGSRVTEQQGKSGKDQKGKMAEEDKLTIEMSLYLRQAHDDKLEELRVAYKRYTRKKINMNEIVRRLIEHGTVEDLLTAEDRM